MIMERLKEIRSRFPFSGLIIFLAGILLLVAPDYSGRGLCYVISGVLIIRGASRLITHYTQKREDYVPFPMESLWNALLIGLGLFIALHSDIVISIVPFAFGIYFLASSVSSLQKSMLLRRMQYEGWAPNILMSILKIILAVLMLCNPFSTAMTMIRFMGLCLIYDSITTFGTELQTAKAKKQQEKAADELRSLNLSSRPVSASENATDIPIVEAEIVSESETEYRE